MKKRSLIPLLLLEVLAITYFLGPVPEAPIYQNSWPELPSSLNLLDTYIQQHEDSLPIREDNQARIRWYDSVPSVTEYSFVYLHGFAGSYRDGFPLNVSVADTFGANVYLARWAGHGLQPFSTLEYFTPERAWQSALEALAVGRKIGRKVILMSTSTGGTLAIKLAATFPDSVFALINIAPNIQDDQPGAFLLNTPWGYEIAHVVSFGANQKIKHKEAAAAQYWDTIYPAESLINLQVLLESTMQPETFQEVIQPVLTLYYHKNFLQEDEHVEISVYHDVHEMFSTPDSLVELIALDKPETHFIGSDIKSRDWKTAQQVIVSFCQQKLGMPLADPRKIVAN